MKHLDRIIELYIAKLNCSVPVRRKELKKLDRLISLYLTKLLKREEDDN
jgi:uncharacterized protein (UPF0216 family)